MASIKTYMLVPHHDFPADGPILLGTIILDPQQPGESLNEAEIPEIPPTSKYSCHKYNWEQTVDSTRNGNTSVWARCVNILGLGGSFGLGFNTVAVDHYRFADLETTFFTPSQDYIEKAVKTPKVRSFLEGARYVPVYMVTGVKIVRGPGSHVVSRRSIAQGGQANISVPSPMGAGGVVFDSGDVSFGQGGTANTSFNGSSDFVIGYRVGKITFQKVSEGDRVPRHQRHEVGAMLGISEGRANEDAPTVKVILEEEEGIAEELHRQNMVAIGAIDEADDKDCKCFVVPLLPIDHK
jgi:hypothetical protein